MEVIPCLVRTELAAVFDGVSCLQELLDSVAPRLRRRELILNITGGGLIFQGVIGLNEQVVLLGLAYFLIFLCYAETMHALLVKKK